MYYFDIETKFNVPKSIVQYLLVNLLAARMAIAHLTKFSTRIHIQNVCVNARVPT